MGINLGSSFTRTSSVPLDDSLIVDLLSDLTSIDSGIRYEGMTVYCKEDLTNYQLVGGITNGDWTVFSGGGGGGSGLPSGGDQYAVIEKQSSTLGDADWTSPISFAGYSARYAQTIALNGLKAALDFIFNIQYTAPLISLSAAGSGTVREKGASVASTLLTATITKNSDPINEVRFYLSPSTLLDTQTSGGGIPTGGASTYNYASAFTDNISFYARVDDDGTSGGPTTVTSNTVSFTFVYPYYYGADVAGLSAAQVRSDLTTYVITSNANVTRSFTASASDVFYFAYPASYGALTSILDVNGFETIGDWTLTTTNITGLDASAVSYRIYEFNNPVTAGTYQFTFVR